MEAEALGFNEHFVNEVVALLLPFRVQTRTLRNAAIHVVADRYSMYVGRDECPTRAVDISKMLTSPNLKPQSPRCPIRYSTRLLARLGRDDIETVERILNEFPTTLCKETQRWEPLVKLHSLRAVAAIIIVGAPLVRVSRYTGFTQRQILKAVADCLETSYRRIVQLFDNLALPPQQPRRFGYVDHLAPLDF